MAGMLIILQNDYYFAKIIIILASLGHNDHYFDQNNNFGQNDHYFAEMIIILLTAPISLSFGSSFLALVGSLGCP